MEKTILLLRMLVISTNPEFSFFSMANTFDENIEIHKNNAIIDLTIFLLIYFIVIPVLFKFLFEREGPLCVYTHKREYVMVRKGMNDDGSVNMKLDDDTKSWLQGTFTKVLLKGKMKDIKKAIRGAFMCIYT